MAPITEKSRREEKVDAVLAFARHLEDTLNGTNHPTSLNAELCKEIEKIGLLHGAAATCKSADLDKQGTQLWNLASKLKTKKQVDSELLCAVRVFAYLLLDCAGRHALGLATNQIRILRTALRTAKYCLAPEERQLALAEMIVERAASHNESLNKSPDTQDDTAKSLSIEYTIIRIALAWRQDRLDLAKMMLTKVNSAKHTYNPSLAEELSDILFEIGKGLSQNSRWLDALFWLEAAYDALATQRREDLSSDAGELRVSIMHAMAKGLIRQGEGNSREKAWHVVRELSIEYGDKLIVLLLKLELLAVETFPSAEEYRDTLQKIASTVHLTDSNISTILYHTHKLKAWNANMAHQVLFNFLTDRILGGEHQVWLEKTLITIIWNLTTSADIPNEPSTLTHVFDHIEARSSKSIRPSATHAAQILLWKRIETAYSQEKYELAEQWCNLSLHCIFTSSGSMNIGKLQRKLILCTLGMNNPTKAGFIVATMSDANKSNCFTQYLLYKVAMRRHDSEMAAQCFNTICSSLNKEANKDASLIYACVLEAQRHGDQSQIISALQQVLERFEYSAPSGIHLPALLRCTARLLMRSSEQLHDDKIDSLCTLFESAATQAKRLRQQDKASLFTINELDWFSRNCYNLSLKVCHVWPPHQTLRLVQTALNFIDVYPVDLDPAVVADLCLRRLFCNFVLCSLCIHLARSENNVESQLQHYLSARHCVAKWRSHLADQISRLESGARSDMANKHATLIAYDFEAAARLKSWQDFDSIIEECRECENLKVYAILADIILASEAPTEVIVKSLQQIVNATWQIEGRDVEKLSRWIRCLVSQALSSDKKTVEKLLDQVLTIVETADKAQGQGEPYPAEELEWLATTTFNRAIDFYCSSQDIECRRWAEKALTLGALCRDGGALHGVLQEKFQNLVWQDR